MHVLGTMDAYNKYMYSIFWVKVFFPSFIKKSNELHRWHISCNSSCSKCTVERMMNSVFFFTSFTHIFAKVSVHSHYFYLSGFSSLICTALLLPQKSHQFDCKNPTRCHVLEICTMKRSEMKWPFEHMYIVHVDPLSGSRVRSVSILWVCFGGVVSWHGIK